MARWAGLPDLKMPEPTNTPSAPSCIIIAASAGVAMPPAVNRTTGSLPPRRPRGRARTVPAAPWPRRTARPRARFCSRRSSWRMCAHVGGGVRDVTGAGLTLRADHRRALGDPAQRLAEVGRAAHERDGERPLVDVVGVVGRGEHLGLVDVVDAEALQHLGLDEVADAGLGHHRDRDGADDAFDHVGVAHPGDPALGADVGRHALERHHRDGAGVLGDLGLLGGDHVHDHAALEHLGHAALDPRGPYGVFGHEPDSTSRQDGCEPTRTSPPGIGWSGASRA